jgi:hypothetical protein
MNPLAEKPKMTLENGNFFSSRFINDTEENIQATEK